MSFHATRTRALLLICTLALAGCGAGGGSESPAGPSVSLTANPTSVASGGVATLTWSSTNAASCSAAGAWSGTKATSGTQSTGPLTTSSTFSLTCSGPDGSASASVQVSVTGTPPPAPTLSISANPTAIASGGSSTISWSSTNAAACTASGSWSGAKATSGSQTINSIVATSTYILTCTGSDGGSTTRSAIVNVTGGAGAGVSGAVDSSLLNRHQESGNLMYAFAGFSTTSGAPVATASVIQNVGTCTFRYDLAGLPNGSYTVALTKDNGTTFTRSANVTVAGGAVVQNFAPANVLQVGPGRQHTHPNAVIGVVQSGDVVEIDAGTYTNTQGIWTRSNLTIRGVGGRAHLVAAPVISNEKAIWVTQGTNTAVENIEFSQAVVPDLNGAGIRVEGRDLVVCGSSFHDNQQGMLGNDNVGNILIEYSEFARNGNCIDINAGCAHHVYFSHNDRVIMRYNYLHHAFQGHLIKSRAKENYILYNRVMDEASGQSSYQINLTNGGLAYVIGNLIQKGPNSDNSGAMITFGEDGFSNPRRKLYVVNNTFVNDLGGSLGRYIEVSGGSETAVVMNNLFVGSGAIVGGGGSATQTTNVQTNTPNLANRAAFDYRPTASTPGIDQGATPGMGDGFDLTPILQYLHPHNREARPVRNGVDVGAYELP